MNDIFTAAVEQLNARIKGTQFEQSIALVIENVGTLLVDSSGARLSEERGDCAIFANEKTMLGLLDGSVKVMPAVMTGKLKIKGDPRAALKLTEFLD
ncbi:MAG: SCP2 sterol-binding domain-containing protein [Paracoccaceae bacterium]